MKDRSRLLLNRSLKYNGFICSLALCACVLVCLCACVLVCEGTRNIREIYFV
jgi:hypothetical protein